MIEDSARGFNEIDGLRCVTADCFEGRRAPLDRRNEIGARTASCSVALRGQKSQRPAVSGASYRSASIVLRRFERIYCRSRWQRFERSSVMSK
jgi:hypothetical protein